MSLLSSLTKYAIPAITGYLTGGPMGAGAAVLGARGGAPAQTAAMTGAGAAGIASKILMTGRAALPALPGIGAKVGTAVATVRASKGLAKIGSAAMTALNLYAVGSLVYDAAGNVVGRKGGTRRINPLNHRALRRAITRVKSARNICHAVERELPKQRASRGRCAPQPRCAR